MLGFEMMLKSMGIDPEEVKKAVTNIGNIANIIDARLARIEKRQILICQKLDIPLSENEGTNNGAEHQNG